MTRFARAPLVWLVAALVTALAVIAITGGEGDKGGQPGGSPRGATRPESAPHAKHPSDHGRSDQRSIRSQVHEAVAASPRAHLDTAQREVARVGRAYVTALNARDGDRACGLFAHGALAGVDFPRDRGGCAPSLAASIGYRDPRGFPVYEHARIARIRSVAIDGSQASITATVVTRFAGNREPSVEDDLIYLRRQGGRWLIVKPSVILYRAIGIGDIPPQVLAPP